MKAADVMSRNVVAVGSGATVLDAIRLMLDKRISGLPVVDDDAKLIGILTEGDLLHRSETGTARNRPAWLGLLIGPGRLAGEYVRTHGRRVGEVMTHEVVSVSEDTPLEQVVQLMDDRRIKRVPVLREGALVGIVSRADLLRALAERIAEENAEPGSDEQIRRRLIAELEKSAWSPREGLTITVKDGAVEFSGVIFDENEREAMRVAAENVPGVKSVHDHLVWVEPVSGLIVEGAPEEGSTEDPPQKR